MTSLQTLFEQVPLTQLLRQQSVSVVHDPPFAWQKLGVAHTVPSQTPLQQGTPEAHAAPVRRQAGVMPPSGPPLTLPGPFPGGLTDPLQLQAPNVRTAPRDQRRRNGREIRIEDILRERQAGSTRRDGKSMIAPIARPVEEAEVRSLRTRSANPRARRRLCACLHFAAAAPRSSRRASRVLGLQASTHPPGSFNEARFLKTPSTCSRGSVSR